MKTVADNLFTQITALMNEEKSFANIFKDFVLKDNNDFVISGERFPLSQNCIHALAKLLQPRSYLEIGTRYGYSLGAIVHGSNQLERAVSVDIVDRKSQITENIETIRHIDRLEVLNSSSEEFDTEEQFDMVYVDGDHKYQTALKDMRKFWKNVKPGGLMLVDDTINERWDGISYTEEDIGVYKAVKEFSSTANDVDSAVLQYPTYSGFCIIVKEEKQPSNILSAPEICDVSSSSDSPQEKALCNDASTLIDDKTIIKAFTDNPGNAFLVSFPRTGSHWLRMLMELYFERPSLVRVFYYPERKDYLTLHTHDLDLDVERSNVIYLYRDPVDTVFSQMNYYKEDIGNPERIYYWSNLYARHLNKWLHDESFTKKKTVLRYELLKADLVNEFRKICNHFELPFDETCLLEAAKRISKEHVKGKTPHDTQVINLSNSYGLQRDEFRKEQSEFIWQTILDGRQHLQTLFDIEAKQPDKKIDGGRTKFSGFVVTYNEAHHLRRCLSRLSFCDQLVVIDLGSSDASVEIAKEFNAEVIFHQRVPVVEQIWTEIKPYAKNEWLVIIDPDEELPEGIEDELQKFIENSPNLGAIKLPLQFYFKNKPLYWTHWGQGQIKICVFNKHRVIFSSDVHRGRSLIEGSTLEEFPKLNPGFFVKHYWADSYRELFRKHLRYIKNEGKSRFNSGHRFSWRETFKETFNAVKENLIKYNGLQGGFIGIFLSFFYGWYVLMSCLSLRRYEYSTAQAHE